MNINLNQTSNIYDADRFSVENPKVNINQSEGKANISNLPVGSTFKGDVVNVVNDTVTLMLEGNVNLSARLSDMVNLNIGDSIEFIVKDNNGSSVMIKPNQTNSVLNDMLGKIIENNGFTPSEKNFMIAEALVNNNMSTDKAQMQRIMQAAYKFPDASINDIVALDKLGIPINENNLNQYNSYINNSHQINNDISNISDNISDLISELASENIDDAINVSSEITDIFFDRNETADTFNEIKNEILLTDSDIDVGKGLNDNTSVLTENGTSIGDNLAENGTVSDNLINQADGNSIKSDLNNVLLSKLLNVDERTTDSFMSLLEEAGVSKDDISNVITNSNNKNELINGLLDLIKNNSDIEKSIIGKQEFLDFLKSSIKSELSLNPEKMKDSKEIDNLYKANYEKLDKLINDFSQSGTKQGESMSQTARDMQGKMEFIQNLNEMYAYAQMPVKLSGDDFNSELFVYMNKKAMNMNKKDISAMLHLDMDNLGPTDVHVTLSNNDVVTRFYVEDEESARIIDEHMNMLEKALKDSGYNLKNETVTREIGNTNLVVKEVLQSDLEKSVKRYSFDVRM